MQVYTFQQEEKVTERKTSQQLQSQIPLLLLVRLTGDGKAK